MLNELRQSKLSTVTVTISAENAWLRGGPQIGCGADGVSCGCLKCESTPTS